MQSHFEIPLSAPDVTERDIRRVAEVLRSPHLSLGPRLAEFEREFARYVGTRFAVAVNSGTSALHLAVKGLAIGDGDAVITTPFSFIASANCLLFEGAAPVFVDIEPDTFNIDPAGIIRYLATGCRRDKASGVMVDRDTGRHVRAVLPVHVFGHPCEMDALREIADEYRLRIIEDACEAVGAEYRGAKAGSLGDVGVFGFYPNKQMTTGEGGMLVTDDKDVADFAASLRNQGRSGGSAWLDHHVVGYNYRLDEMSCALGLGQLARIDEILAKRSAVADLYAGLLKDVLPVPSARPEVKKSWFVYVLCLPEEYGAGQRDRLLAGLREERIGCNNYFPPIHLQPFYRKAFGYKEGDFPMTEAVSRRTVALPFYNNLREEDVSRVVDTLLGLLARLGAAKADPLVRSA